MENVSGAAGATAEVSPDILEGLNEPQAEAVSTLWGPLVVVAGPGSGKTRVLTHRIAALLEAGVAPWSILAVTFTNKAAAEMRTRITNLVGDEASTGMWISTFHSACVRILRRDADAVGISKDFTILDDRDTLAALKSIAAERDWVLDAAEVKQAANRISFAKNHGEGPDDAAVRYRDQRLGELYAAYRTHTQRISALDFDDLLLVTAELLRDHPEVTERYQRKFSHICVDEFQDTNQVQYEIVRALAAGRRNLCVVGDLDQSVYSWRGSQPEIMATFTADFGEAAVVVLEQNYRSTKAILAVAQAVIDPNPAQWRPRLWTGNDEGAPVRLYVADDDRDEAAFIVDEISATGADLSDCAVLVRTNAQTRILEEELNARRMPYQVVGALRFYDRAEVKDALAYLRVALNPADEVSFARCVNTPRRRIGPAAVATIIGTARRDDVDILTAAGAVIEEASVPAGARSGLEAFLAAVDAVADAVDEGPGAALSAAVFATGLHAAVAAAADGVGRSENLEELVAAAERFADGPVPTDPTVVEVADLDGREATRAFLENVTLVSADEISGDGDTAGRVQILTAHAAKGKEFRHVFVAGCEQNLFPHSRSLHDPDAMAEERRLLFVACSRAEETLTITRCSQRMLYGNQLSHNEPSVFLADFEELLTPVAARRGRARWQEPHRGGRRWSPDRGTGARHTAQMSTPRVDASVALRPAPPRSGPRVAVEELTVGARVRHSTFGIGVIEAVDGRSAAATVRFGSVAKELLLDYAPMELVTGD